MFQLKNRQSNTLEMAIQCLDNNFKLNQMSEQKLNEVNYSNSVDTQSSQKKRINQINYNNQVIDFEKSEIPDSHVVINVCLGEGTLTRISISSHEFILKMISWGNELSRQQGMISYSVGK